MLIVYLIKYYSPCFIKSNKYGQWMFFSVLYYACLMLCMLVVVHLCWGIIRPFWTSRSVCCYYLPDFHSFLSYVKLNVHRFHACLLMYMYLHCFLCMDVFNLVKIYSFLFWIICRVRRDVLDMVIRENSEYWLMFLLYVILW